MKKRSVEYFALNSEVKQTIEYRVKLSIIKAKGLTHTKPENLQDTTSLKIDLLYNQMNFDALCNVLRNLVKSENENAELKCGDVNDCAVVNDVIKLIKDTIA